MSESKLIDELKNLLKRKMYNFSQHHFHACLYGNYQLNRLTQYEISKIREEIQHITKLLNRVLELEEELSPTDRHYSLSFQKTPAEIFKYNMKLSERYMARCKKIGKHCDQTDKITSNLLNDIIADEEEFVDWTKDQLQQINMLGFSNYIQMQRALCYSI